MCPKCPFYMKVTNSLSSHGNFENKIVIPAFNKTVKLCVNENDDRLIFEWMI